MPINLLFTQGSAESFIFINEFPQDGEVWDLLYVKNSEDADVGLSSVGSPLEYPITLLAYGTIPGTYYSPKIRIDTAGKFIGQIRRRSSTESVALAIEVLPVATASSDSSPEDVDPVQVADDASLVLGRIVLSDISGTSIANKSIYLYPVGLPVGVDSSTAIGGIMAVGLVEAAVTIKTNGVGYAEVKLIKGMRVRLSFEGSRLVKEITVPESDFNLFTIVSIAPDFISVVVPAYTNVLRSS